VLASKLSGGAADIDPATIAVWLQQLDHDEFAVREKATTQLAAHFAAARTAMEQERKRTTSAEVRARLERLLARAALPLSEAERTEQLTRRILQIIAERRKS
jgi:hypothetical protein